MSKLTAPLLLSAGLFTALLAPSGAVLGSHAAGPSIPSGTSALRDQLVAASRAGAITAEQAVTMMLEAGPQATAAMYRSLAEHPLKGELAAALAAAPAVIARVTGIQDLPRPRRRHAVQVALEVLKGSESPIAPASWNAVFRGASLLPFEESLARGIRAAIAGEHRRATLDASTLAAWIRSAGRTFGSTVVDGAAQAKALMPLAGTLRHTTGQDGAILNRVASLVRSGVPVVAEPVRKAALPYLHSTREFERAEAAALFGLIGDRRHVEPLVEQLEHDTPLVRAASLKALKALTGMTISGDPERWMRWYEDQETWWHGTGASLVAGLPHAGRDSLVQTLRDVATRRLYRREIARELVSMLQNRPADEIRVTVAALATLRDPETLEHVLALREHPDEGVRASVADAVVAFRHAGIKPSKVRALPSY